jgi:hypothetical protein
MENMLPENKVDDVGKTIILKLKEEVAKKEKKR